MADNGTFDDIHGAGSGTIQTGPDFGTIIGIDNSKSAAAAEAAGEGSVAGDEIMRAEKAVSFSVYWDVQEKKYKVHDPTVIFPDSESVTMPQPTFSAATFLVEITRDSSGVYAAAWKTSTETPSRYRIMAVPVFKLLNSVVTQYHTGVIVVGGADDGGNQKPWDIETEIDGSTGLPRLVMRRCLVTNTNPSTDLGDWRSFPNIGDGETYTIYLRMTLPKKQRVDSEPEATYDVVAVMDGTDPNDDEENGLAVLYPLYRLGSGGKVLVDYRDAFVRTFNFWTDERSISRDNYPDFQQVLSLRHFYSDDGDLDSQTIDGAGSCYLVLRAKLGNDTRPRVYYVSLSELKKIVRGTAGGTTIINNINNNNDDDDDWISWLENAVTNLNGLNGNTAIIGGPGIVVTQEGNSVRIEFDPDKDWWDENPYPDKFDVNDPCMHFGDYGGIHRVNPDEGGVISDPGDQSGGEGQVGKGCDGNSTVAGTTGSSTSGVSGMPATEGTSGGAGVEKTQSMPEGKSGEGLYNGSKIPRQTMEDTQARVHDPLTNTKTMTDNPWGSTGQIGQNATTPLYSGTHTPLVNDTKTMNNPWRSGGSSSNTGTSGSGTSGTLNVGGLNTGNLNAGSLKTGGLNTGSY